MSLMSPPALPQEEQSHATMFSKLPSVQQVVLQRVARDSALTATAVTLQQQRQQPSKSMIPLFATMADREESDSKLHRILLTKFPKRLHEMLDDADRLGFSDVVCWLPCGMRFRIIHPERLVPILAKYFQQTKWKSFLRQLQNYGFVRERNVCTHPLFLRGQPDLVEQMRRQKGQLEKAQKAKTKVNGTATAADKTTTKTVRVTPSAASSASSVAPPAAVTSLDTKCTPSPTAGGARAPPRSPSLYHPSFAAQSLISARGALPPASIRSLTSATGLASGGTRRSSIAGFPTAMAVIPPPGAARRRSSISGFLKSQQKTTVVQQEMDNALFWRQRALALAAAAASEPLRDIYGTMSRPAFRVPQTPSSTFHMTTHYANTNTAKPLPATAAAGVAAPRCSTPASDTGIAHGASITSASVVASTFAARQARNTLNEQAILAALAQHQQSSSFYKCNTKSADSSLLLDDLEAAAALGALQKASSPSSLSNSRRERSSVSQPDKTTSEAMTAV